MGRKAKGRKVCADRNRRAKMKESNLSLFLEEGTSNWKEHERGCSVAVLRLVGLVGSIVSASVAGV